MANKYIEWYIECIERENFFLFFKQLTLFLISDTFSLELFHNFRWIFFFRFDFFLQFASIFFFFLLFWKTLSNESWGRYEAHRAGIKVAVSSTENYDCCDCNAQVRWDWLNVGCLASISNTKKKKNNNIFNKNCASMRRREQQGKWKYGKVKRNENTENDVWFIIRFCLRC